jgi:hypothetical protein
MGWRWKEGRVRVVCQKRCLDVGLRPDPTHYLVEYLVLARDGSTSYWAEDDVPVTTEAEAVARARALVDREGRVSARVLAIMYTHTALKGRGR